MCATAKDGAFYTEISGEDLDAEKVRVARRDEVEYYECMAVLEKVDYTVAQQRTGRCPIECKWVDVAKEGGEAYAPVGCLQKPLRSSRSNTCLQS